MSYTVHNAEGVPVAGDAVLSQGMKDYADEIGGYITDDTTGDRVYPEEG